MEIKIKTRLSYDDILIEPQYSDIESRADVDPSQKLTRIDWTFSIPFITSPMNSISESRMAVAVTEYGGLSIIHRYNTIREQVGIANMVFCTGVEEVGAAIGVKGDFLERAENLVKSGVNVIAIDVAHGWHSLMERAIKTIRDNKTTSNVHIMAGNVATVGGYDALGDWGADSVRLGIGTGAICSTRLQTGHGYPVFQSILDCATDGNGKAQIIADGGIRENGDGVKALAAGADFVMCGGLVSATVETPGQVFYEQPNGLPYKIYKGMASREAESSRTGTSKVAMAPEGIAARVPFSGRSVKDVLREFEGSLRSGMSYSGARTIKELQQKAKFIRQTTSGQVESSTHILKK